MKEMGVPDNIIHEFANANYWLSYFPPIAINDLKKLGLATDFRRSFITTEVNKYFDAFVRWQFITLKNRNKLKFGKRLSIFSPKNQQPCADHDRASGEGVGPQEYTLIKIKIVVDQLPDSLCSLNGRNIYLVAATLRPETMYGQTNCFVLPDGVYNAYEMKNNDIFICSKRSALNMMYQGLTKDESKLTSLAECKGWDLLGLRCKAPLTSYEYVYVWPLLTISMGKGTGIVTSVPSDAPDDYAAMRDLQKKADMRKKFNLTDDMVLPYKVISIINIPEYGDTSAATLCEERKVQSQNDKQKLALIKEEVYTKGFYNGKMIVGKYNGELVSEAKPKVMEDMIANNLAAKYYEPESTVIARSGEECVVAYTDQWYIPYGEDEWKAQVASHVKNVLETFNPAAKKEFGDVVEWLHEWGCSRTYGLGTYLPCDEQFLIESLSDSTIYMSYYTISHFLQGGVIDGSKPGEANIKPEQLTPEVFDYIFLGKAYPENCDIEKSMLTKMRNEFLYWYPMDLRVSGKDLIRNHLTMSLYNHAAIWENDSNMLPRAFFTNGHLQINNEKMSKSTGNFMTLRDALEKFGTDATRLGLADAGDTLLDANFDESVVNAGILRLTTEHDWIIEEVYEKMDTFDKNDDYKNDLQAQIFNNSINCCIRDCREAYSQIKYHDAIKYGHFNLISARDQYRANVDKMNLNLIIRYIKAYLIMLSPICPHYTQNLWEQIGEKNFIYNAKWPEFEDEDILLTSKATYLASLSHDIASSAASARKPKKKQKMPVVIPDHAIISISNELPITLQKALEVMKIVYNESNQIPKDINRKVWAEISADKSKKFSKREKNDVMKFVAAVSNKTKDQGIKAFEFQLPFNEYEFVKTNMDVIIRGAIGIETGEVAVANQNQSAMPGKPNIQLIKRNEQ